MQAEKGYPIVGFGARTAIGDTAPTSAAGLRANIVSVAFDREYRRTDDDAYVTSRASYLEPNTNRTSRILGLAIPAIREALGHIPGDADEPVGLVLGLGEDLDHGAIADVVKDHFPGLSHFEALTAGGATTGMSAVGRAMELINRGLCKWCVAGSSDSLLDADLIASTDEQVGVRSEEAKSGRIPGEAAAFLLLVSDRLKERRNLPEWGRLLRVATVRETAESKDGSALTEAIRQCVAELGGPVTDLIGTYDGRQSRAKEFAYATTRLSPHFQDRSTFRSPDACIGSVGASAGPLFLMDLALSMKKNYSIGHLGLAWTASDSGYRSAAVVTRGRDGK